MMNLKGFRRKRPWSNRDNIPICSGVTEISHGNHCQEYRSPGGNSGGEPAEFESGEMLHGQPSWLRGLRFIHLLMTCN
jgi:hypothetical protein